MIRSLVLVSALVALTPAANAQQANSRSGASAIAIAKGGGGGNATPSTQTIRNVPDMSVGFAGGNPCSVGGGVGVSVAGAGVSGVFSSEATDCTRRNWAIYLAEVGLKYNDPTAKVWSLRLACLNEDVARAAPSAICSVTTATASPPAYADSCARWAEIVQYRAWHGLPLNADQVAARQACHF